MKVDQLKMGSFLSYAQMALGLIVGILYTPLMIRALGQSEYGLYIKVVNGITADYDVDQSYWGFSKGGEYMMTGVDGTPFADGEVYELT